MNQRIALRTREGRLSEAKTTVGEEVASAKKSERDYSAHQRSRSGNDSRLQPVTAIETRPWYQLVATSWNCTRSPSRTMGAFDRFHTVNFTRPLSSSSRPTWAIFGWLGSHSCVTVPSTLTSRRPTSPMIEIGRICPGASWNSSNTPTTAPIIDVPSNTRSAIRRLIAALDHRGSFAANRAASRLISPNSSRLTCSRGSGSSGSAHRSTHAARFPNFRRRSVLTFFTIVRVRASLSEVCRRSNRTFVRSTSHSLASNRSSSANVSPSNPVSGWLRSTFAWISCSTEGRSSISSSASTHSSACSTSETSSPRTFVLDIGTHPKGVSRRPATTTPLVVFYTTSQTYLHAPLAPSLAPRARAAREKLL